MELGPSTGSGGNWAKKLTLPRWASPNSNKHSALGTQLLAYCPELSADSFLGHWALDTTLTIFVGCRTAHLGFVAAPRTLVS